MILKKIIVCVLFMSLALSIDADIGQNWYSMPLHFAKNSYEYAHKVAPQDVNILKGTTILLGLWALPFAYQMIRIRVKKKEYARKKDAVKDALYAPLHQRQFFNSDIGKERRSRDLEEISSLVFDYYYNEEEVSAPLNVAKKKAQYKPVSPWYTGAVAAISGAQRLRGWLYYAGPGWYILYKFWKAPGWVTGGKVLGLGIGLRWVGNKLLFLPMTKLNGKIEVALNRTFPDERKLYKQSGYLLLKSAEEFFALIVFKCCFSLLLAKCVLPGPSGVDQT